MHCCRDNVSCNKNFRGRLVGLINTGVTPSSIAITPNGRYAYVTNSNNYEAPGQDSVTVIDLNTNLPITTIFDKSFNEPYRVTIDDKGTKAYISNSGGSTITIIDIKTNKVSDIIDGFDGPSGMVIKDNVGYVNNYGAFGGVGSGNGTTVSVVDLRGKVIIETITTGLAPAAIVLHGKYVYTVNYVDGEPNTGTLTKIDTRTNTVIATIGPFIKDGFSGPFSMAINDNGKRGYVTNFGSNNFTPFGTTVSVVDLTRNLIIDTIYTGIQPTGIVLDDQYAYVSNYNTLYAHVIKNPPPTRYLDLTPGQGSISVINLETNKVISTVAVGHSPNNLAITPDNKYLYIVNYTQNNVGIVKLSSSI
jgi:YVTN family beta-propeller protein